MSKESKQAKKAAKAEKKAAKKANGRNPEVTKSVISAVTAIVCVIAIVLTGISITDKICKTNLDIAEKYPVAGSAVADNAGTQDGADDANVPGTEAPVDNGDIKDEPGEVPADAPVVTPDDNSSTPSTPASTGDKTPAAKPAGPTAPTAKADIINYYNTAINKVVSSKAGFKKTRVTTLGTLKGAEAIMKISVARDAVNSFLGVGTKDYTNKKGSAEHISKSALTAADVKTAKCDVSGNIYTITLTLNNGKSSAPGGSDTSPLQRSGLYAGAGDKSAYDYKNANNIYVGLNNADNASVEKVVEQTTNSKLVAKIDSTTGKIISLQGSFDWTADLTNVKYLVVKVSGVGDAKTSVTFKDFVW